MNRKTIRRMESDESTNKLIYYLRKAPFIGKKINPYIYLNVRMKKTFEILSLILRLIKYLFSKSFYLILFLYSGPRILRELLTLEMAKTYNIMILVILAFNTIRTYTNPVIATDSPLKWMLVVSFKRSYKDFFDYEMYKRIIDRLFFTLFIAFALFNQISFTLLCFVVVYMMSNLFILEYINIKLVEAKTKRNRIIQSLYLSASVTLVALVLYISKIMTSNNLWILTILIGLLAVFIMINIFNYPYHNDIGIKTKIDLNLSNDAAKRNMEMMNDSLRVKEKYIDLDTSKTISEKYTGYSFINRLFLLRHRNLWLKPLAFKLIGITVVGLVFTIGLLFFDESLIERSLLENVSPFIFVFYFLSAGESLCKAYYLNCDYSLLHYPFYTRKETILSQFLHRFITVAGLNLLLVLNMVLFVAFWSLLNLTEFPIYSLLPFILTLSLISLFFSVHPLFMYYIFQPFDKDLNSKSISYHISSFVIYTLAFAADDLLAIVQRPNLIISIVTATYITVALYLVWKFSYKTFRAK